MGRRKKKSPENTAETGSAPPEEFRWRPGQSGNPGGRPKGFARLIREQTNDGMEMVEFALGVMRGEVEVTRVSMVTGATYSEGPTIRDRIEALKWLGDRGFGKPSQAVEVSGPEGKPVETRTEVKHDDSPERLASILRAMAGAGVLPAGAAAEGAGEGPDAATD